MKKKTAHILSGILMASMLMTGMTGCGSSDKKIDGNKTAFTVNGETLPLGEANFMLRYEQGSMYNSYAYFYSMYGISMTGSFYDQSSGEEDGSTQGELLKTDMTRSIENLMLMRQKASEYGVELSEEQIAGAEAAAAGFAEKNGAETMETLGVDEAMLADAMELYAYSFLMKAPMVADVDTEVSDEEAKMSRVSIASVIVNSDAEEDTKAEKKEQLEQFVKKLTSSKKKETVEFTDLQAKVNEALNEEAGNDAENTQQYINASSQTFAANDDTDTTLAAELREAALKLSEGEISEIIETSQGYYVIRLDAELDRDATDQKKETIIDKRKEDLYDSTLDQWLEESKITVNKCFQEIKVTDKDSYYITTDQAEEE